MGVGAIRSGSTSVGSFEITPRLIPNLFVWSPFVVSLSSAVPSNFILWILGRSFSSMLGLGVCWSDACGFVASCVQVFVRLSSVCPSITGVGPCPIGILESSQLQRQCCSIILQCNSWIAFNKAFSLLASIDSCSAEWNNVGLRVVPRSRPPLPACACTRLSLSRIMCGAFFCNSPFGCGRVCVPYFPPYTDLRTVPADSCSSSKG